MIPKDESRERRIDYEAIVDCYDELERSMGWYYYLESKFATPFKARIAEENTLNPLETETVVTVISLASEDCCEHDMFVNIECHIGKFSIPLQQITPIEADSETLEAIEDWQYWKARGYQF